MKKNLTELVFILDRSGSMHGLEKDTVEGFNSMIEKQRAAEGEALVTTVLFDNEYEVLHNRTDIQGVAPLTYREYYVRGCTALLDAIGKTIEKIEKSHKYMLDGARPEKVIFVIITDGYENSSRKYSYGKICKMIDKRKESGWEFIFMGANMDAVKEASKLGIDEERAVTFKNDSRGVRLNYTVMSETIAAMRENPRRRVDGSWKAAIEKDCAERS